jgi:integrase/recombinase XerD
MRVGEAARLKLFDVDLEAGVLHIRGTKFDQWRLIPVHSSTRKALLDYRSIRDKFLAERKYSSDHFFVTMFGNPLEMSDIHRRFYTLSRMIGIREQDSAIGPRIHDFRHRFAMETLRRWYRDGEDVERKLPLLSTYLGHVQAKDTYWYFTACPELMGAAVGLVDRRWEDTL